MRMRMQACLTSFAAMTVVAGTLSAQEPYPGLEAYVSKAMETWKIPGISIAIVRNDSVIYAKGFGAISFDGKTPVSDQTLFEIGSSSKAFTSAVVAMLVSDGKMRFDERLSTYLPDFRMYDPVASADVTVRDALSHRSGIARGELAWLGSGVTRSEVLHRVRFLKPESPFRSRWSYQNMMFLAAGEAAGKAAGTTWDDLVRHRIFEPLGMTSSLTSSTNMTNKNVALPHGLTKDSVYRKPFMEGDNIGPAGSILSNARDMGQWLRFQLGDGTFNGKRLLSAATLRETHTPQIVTAANAGGGAPDSGSVTRFNTYGMGWFVQDYRQQLMWQHGGNTDGSTAAVGMLPEQKLGVAVLSNMNGAQLPNLIMRYIFDRQLNAPMRDWSAEAYSRYLTQRRRADSASAALASKRVAGGAPPLPLTAYAGTYADSLYGDVTIVVEGNRLELKHGSWHGPLEYWNANNFQWTVLPSSPASPMIIKFDIAPDNSVTGLYYGLGADATLLGRKGGRGGGRSGGAP
jgi:CubicO group peptidase (beta-lactamase class C family)